MNFHRFSWGRAPRALQWQVWTSLPSSMHSSCGVNYLFIYLFIWNRVTCSLNWPQNSQCSWECHWITEPPAFKSPVLGLWMCSIVLSRANQILSVSCMCLMVLPMQGYCKAKRQHIQNHLVKDLEQSRFPKILLFDFSMFEKLCFLLSLGWLLFSCYSLIIRQIRTNTLNIKKIN